MPREVQQLLDTLATGAPKGLAQSYSGWEPKKLWRAAGPGLPYEECAFAEGFDSRADGRSLVAADLDGDGDLDLVLLNRGAPRLQLFVNEGEAGAAVELVLQPATGHREADAAVVRTSRGAFSVALARGYSSSVEPKIHLGLGAQAQVQVEVRWRSGAVEQFPALPAGFVHTLAEGTGRAVKSTPFLPRAARAQRPFPSTLAALGLEPSEQLTVAQLFLAGCKPCAEEAPRLNALAKSGRARVVGFGLHPEGEPLTTAAKGLGLEYPVRPLGEAAADALSAAGQLPLPLLLVYDRAGALARVLPGPAGLEATLAELGVATRAEGR